MWPVTSPLKIGEVIGLLDRSGWRLARTGSTCILSSRAGEGAGNAPTSRVGATRVVAEEDHVSGDSTRAPKLRGVVEAGRTTPQTLH
jgi:hypothetical protein